jgi:hypothetical protein
MQCWPRWEPLAGAAAATLQMMHCCLIPVSMSQLSLVGYTYVATLCIRPDMACISRDDQGLEYQGLRLFVTGVVSSQLQWQRVSQFLRVAGWLD